MNVSIECKSRINIILQILLVSLLGSARSKTGETQPPEAGRATETTPECRKSQKSPEFIRASGEICKKVKFYPPIRALVCP